MHHRFGSFKNLTYGLKYFLLSSKISSVPFRNNLLKNLSILNNRGEDHYKDQTKFTPKLNNKRNSMLVNKNYLYGPLKLIPSKVDNTSIDTNLIENAITDQINQFSFGLVFKLLIGLPILLWTWKCLMLIIFQRRLIYLPYFPPNSKSQELDQYLESTFDKTKNLESLLNFKKVTIHSSKGNLSIAKNYLLKGSSGPRLDGLIVRTADEIDLTGIIYYLQGNAGNTLARIPIFQTLLLQPSKSNPSSPTLSDLNLSIFALSPRGYWTSAGPLPFPFTPFSPPTSRFNQAGIVSDYRRGLEFIASQAEFAGLPIWVLGHSLGGAAAAQLLSTIDSRGLIGKNPIAGLVLENPLPSVKLMLKTIYPSKWMPYHHLGPFVKDEWDTIRAFRESRKIGKNTWLSQIPLMIIQSQMDELVPPSLTRLTYDAARDNRPDQSDSITRPRYIIIPHALHDTAYLKPKYIKEIYKFIKDTTPK